MLCACAGNSNVRSQDIWLTHSISSRLYNQQIQTASLYEEHGKEPQALMLYQDMLTPQFQGHWSDQQFKNIIENAVRIAINAQDFKAAYDIVTLGLERFPEDKKLQKDQRIIQALRQSYGHNIPKPALKPIQKG